jgi:hypothetical protein
MARIPLYTVATAPVASRPALERVIAASPELPFVLNVWAAMAASPVTLDAYLALREAVERGTTLGARVRSAVALAAGHAIGARYSPAINARIAARAGWNPEEIDALQRGASSDARLDALLAVAREAASTNGGVADATWAAAVAAGWTTRELAEAFVMIALVTFVDGFARFALVDVDAAFRQAASPAAGAA